VGQKDRNDASRGPSQSKKKDGLGGVLKVEEVPDEEGQGPTGGRGRQRTFKTR